MGNAPRLFAHVAQGHGGYSLMLRGDLSGARKKFTKALSLDPGNPIIANNLELLNGSRRFIERPPNNQP